MAFELFDVDPLTGVTTYFDFDESGNVIFRKEQDIEAYLATMQETRNANTTQKGLMDNGREFHLYCTIPTIVQLELMEKGIDIFSDDPAVQRRMFDEINKNYPYCKATYRTHR